MKNVKIEYDSFSNDELLKMKKSEAVEGLTEKQQRFCEYFVEGHNKTIALQKAGYDRTNPNFSYRFFRNENIQRYICWLKARVTNSHLVSAYDVMDAWIRIAFADISDFVDISPYSIRLKPANQIDGQLVKSIKSGKDGISIELWDKLKALDNLSRYVQDMPEDFKQRLEKRRLELMEQDFELKKRASELAAPQKEDDGFMEAIKSSVESIWDSENT